MAQESNRGDGRAASAPKKTKKMGRPRKVILKTEFEKLCAMQCTQLEICGWFGVSPDTITRWCKENYNGKTFADAYKELSQDGLISIRRMQFKHAERSPAMAMFLGKVYLGQRENAVAEEETGQTHAPLIINYNYGRPDGEADE